MKRKRLLFISFFSFFVLLTFSSQAQASTTSDAALIVRGAAKTVGSVLQIPASMMVDSTRVMFPFGILTGGVRGTVRAVVGTVSGTLDMAKGAAPYAKYAILA